MVARYTSILVDRATALVALAGLAGVALAKPALAAPAPSAPVRALGEAWRAFADGDYTGARARADAIDLDAVDNDDYVLYLRAQSAFLTGELATARNTFRQLERHKGSRFRSLARWRLADCDWELGAVQSARKRYLKLVAGDDRAAGDVGVARFRIAEAEARRHRNRAAVRAFARFRIDYPAHPLAERASRRLVELAGPTAAELDDDDRIERAQKLTAAHMWHHAIAELRKVPDDAPAATLRRRDYWTGMTLFKMRRRYGDAGKLLLGVYRRMGKDAASALFHGARARSRADFDREAIKEYQRVVHEYPHSRYAPEAQLLSGWLAFNLGDYQGAIPGLAEMLRRFPRSRFATSARWFLGFSHYLLGEYESALPLFERLSRSKSRLVGGKGDYWHARTLDRLNRTDEANRGYRALVGRFPMSWYALLARARLAERNIEVDLFGDQPADSDVGTTIDSKIDPRLASDPLIRGADELLAAGLVVEAGFELRRGEKRFLKRHSRAAALAMLFDRYLRGKNYNRPWYLSVVYGRRALATWPRGQARIWWLHAYPLAYDQLIEKWRHLGGAPRYYLTSIMRKESGFNPHDLSYADAYGLLQMIPATTRRVAAALGIPYSTDLLYDPEFNIRTGSWYIGRLLSKFRSQIPIGAGSFNSGPRPWMRWLDQRGDRPMDEFIELVPYRGSREYAKKVTETYARYLLLYENVVYQQPLTVDRDYVVDRLTY